ncbi:Monoterpene epsilon-lactone hydrolase [Phytophthora cinnamomi]|uniref:Monoterpene epsilon-lactone hydrolase n=1 Tax=Phytophthora cinnamomi TaxID=4785 RepID=UPI003559DB9E|nr:Monoterpene epsilon-lactone hydrolase [Phytophthora cinnamomi]
MLRVCTETCGERMAIESNAQWIRAQSDLLGSILGWFSCRRFNRSLQAVHFNGLEHVWLRNKQSRPSGTKRLVVLYLHGGGFAVLSPRLYTSLGAELAATIESELKQQSGHDLHVDLLLGNYRKAPEYSFPTQPQDTVALYRDYLLKQEGLSPSQIILAGDSAGGGLVMSTLLRVRESRPELLPLAAMLLAPAVDLTSDEPDAPDCFLSRAMCKAFSVAYHPTYTDPRTWEDASSAHCDLRGLPSVFLQLGRLDYIFQHGDRLASKANADGVRNWEVDVHDDMPHVFTIFPSFVLPYAQVGVRKLSMFAAKCFLKRESCETRDARAC